MIGLTGVARSGKDTFFSILKKYLREKYNIESESKIFIYVGILEKGRGLDILIEISSNPHFVA